MKLSGFFLLFATLIVKVFGDLDDGDLNDGNIAEKDFDGSDDDDPTMMRDLKGTKKKKAKKPKKSKKGESKKSKKCSPVRLLGLLLPFIHVMSFHRLIVTPLPIFCL